MVIKLLGFFVNSLFLAFTTLISLYVDVLSLQATDFAVVGRDMLEDLPSSFFRSTTDRNYDGRTSDCWDGFSWVRSQCRKKHSTSFVLPYC